LDVHPASGQTTRRDELFVPGNSEMLDQLKYYDGNLSVITNIPDDLKELHKEAFEIDPNWGIKLTADRGKWIDQSQSHNVFMKGIYEFSGPLIVITGNHDVYYKNTNFLFNS